MRRRLLLSLLLAGWLPACTSPPTDLYTLAAIPGTPLRTAPHSIELRRIGLAGYLDRPGIVRAATNYRLLVTGGNNWGEPLGQMLERVLTEALSQRLPDATVFAESGAISARPDIILELDLQRFDPDAAGEVVLLAQAAIRHDGSTGQAIIRTLQLTVPPTGSGTADLVGAMSTALARLADTLARSLAGEMPDQRSP